MYQQGLQQQPDQDTLIKQAHTHRGGNTEETHKYPGDIQLSKNI